MAKKASSKTSKATETRAKAPPEKRHYLSQADVPAYSLTHAIRVPRAIAEQHGYQPTAPLHVAAALDMQPTSSTFRQLAGASIAYGLTKGGYNAEEISIEPLGMRIVRPTEENDDVLARKEALLRPRVIGEFLNKYNSAQLPREDIGRNVLIGMGVPPDRAGNVYELIIESAEPLGILRAIKDKRYVDLAGCSVTKKPAEEEEAEYVHRPAKQENTTRTGGDTSVIPPREHEFMPPADSTTNTSVPDDKLKKRVFIAHGKNRAFLEPIKKLLGFGGLEPLVSVERPTVAQPLPDKVFNEMRSCGAAIIHVDMEQDATDKDGNEIHVLNPNVLIEIGAAAALYGRRYILLVRDGVILPSDLKGLFEVRYHGSTMDSDATIRLLEAINDIKNHSIPERYPASV